MSLASALIAAMVRLAVNCLVLAVYFGVLVYIAQWAGAVCCAAVLVMIAVLYWWNRMKVMILGKKARGLDTLIGENGTAVSGGQRQRIVLARALYKDSDILIMDEATASLDTETERAVLDAIRQLRGSKTLLMVTHHMNLAEACEHVYRIEDRKLRKIR